MFDREPAWVRDHFPGRLKNQDAESQRLARCLAYGRLWGVIDGEADARKFLRDSASAITKASFEGTLTPERLASLLGAFAGPKGFRVQTDPTAPAEETIRSEPTLFGAAPSARRLAARTSAERKDEGKASMSDSDYIDEAAAYGKVFGRFENRPVEDFTRFAARFLSDERRKRPGTHAFEVCLQVYAEYYQMPSVS